MPKVEGGSFAIQLYNAIWNMAGLGKKLQGTVLASSFIESLKAETKIESLYLIIDEIGEVESLANVYKEMTHWPGVKRSDLTTIPYYNIFQILANISRAH